MSENYQRTAEDDQYDRWHAERLAVIKPLLTPEFFATLREIMDSGIACDEIELAKLHDNLIDVAGLPASEYQYRTIPETK